MADPKQDIPVEEIQGYLDFTRQTLVKARAIVIAMMNESFSKETKPDSSFVTDIDLAVEKMVRDEVQSKYPSHGVLGEELPTIQPDSDYRWITDPVDGTQNLVHRLPTFGCILGLHYKGRPLVGGIDHPLLDLNYTAGLGLGAWENSKQITIDDEAATGLEQNEIIALATRAMFDRTGEGELFDSFMKKHDSTRVFYDCFATTRAAAGQVGAFVEYNVRIWDLAASEILVTEAGGVYEEIKVTDQSDAKESFRCAIMGKPSVVAAIKQYF